MVQDKSQALEPTLLPAVDQGQQNENSQELTPAQECSSNAVPDEAKAAQCEQSAPGLLEISAQVDALCILFAVAIISKMYPPPPFFFFSQAEPKSVGASGFYGKDPPLPVDLKQAFLSLNKEKKTSSEQSLHTTVTRRKKTPICSAEFGCTNPAAFQHSLTKTLYCKQHKVNSPDVVKLVSSGKAAN